MTEQHLITRVQRACLLATALLAASHAAVAAGAAPAPAPKAEWITLGTNGGPPLRARVAPIANALVVGEAIYLFDVGNSVLRQADAAGLNVRNVRGVFISHHHVDHNADLGLVMVQVWTFGARKPVPVFGPQGTAALVAGLASANAATEAASFAVGGSPNAPIGSALVTKDLPVMMESPTPVYEDENIRVTAISMDHFQVPPVAPIPVMPTAVAYRVTAGGRDFVYSGDTGPTKRLAVLARGADILFSEVVDIPTVSASLSTTRPGAPRAVTDALIDNWRKNHLEPEVIGQIAADAGVKRVVLTHYVGRPVDAAGEQSLRDRVASKYRGPVTLANDLDRF